MEGGCNRTRGVCNETGAKDCNQVVIGMGEAVYNRRASPIIGIPLFARLNPPPSAPSPAPSSKASIALAILHHTTLINMDLDDDDAFLYGDAAPPAAPAASAQQSAGATAQPSSSASQTAPSGSDPARSS